MQLTTSWLGSKSIFFSLVLSMENGPQDRWTYHCKIFMLRVGSVVPSKSMSKSMVETPAYKKQLETVEQFVVE